MANNDITTKARNPMGPRNEIAVGTKFGKWTVVAGPELKYGRAYAWLCRCECGTELVKLGTILRNTSGDMMCRACAVRVAKASAREDLTGHTFGEWTVVSAADNPSRSNGFFWLCRCNCGSMREFATIHVRTKYSSSSCRECFSAKVKASRAIKIGSVFYRWTVIKRVANYVSQNQHHRQYLCRCECGKEGIVRGSALIHDRTRSCGCLSFELTAARSRNDHPQMATINQLYSSYRGSARDRQYSFELTRAEFWELILKDCHYCGRAPMATANYWLNNDLAVSRFRRTSKHRLPDEGWVTGATIKYNGIDRVDNQRGYHIQNCVSACRDCNAAKRCLPAETFIALCKLVASRHQ